MRPRLLILFAITGAVLALDQWTKQWATRTLAGAAPMPVVGDLVHFTYVRNSGVAFGLGAGLPFPYYLFSIAAVLAILYLFLRRRVQGPGRRVALALIMGGALGNLVDRLSTGTVVDFIDIGWGRWHWPVFNVADSAVTVGVVLFALTWPRGRPEHEASDPAPVAGDAPPGPPTTPTGDQAHHEGAEARGPAARPGGAARPLPGHGADGPLA